MRLIDADVFKENMDYICDAGGWLEPVTKAVREFVKRHIDAQTTANPEPHWIPCDERLPEEGKVVLWCNEKGSVFTTAITVRNDHSWAVGKRHRFSRVIAWMPLPEPYQPEVEEEE